METLFDTMLTICNKKLQLLEVVFNRGIFGAKNS